MSTSQGTPKTTREAILNALAELSRPGPHDVSKEPKEIVADVIMKHLRDRHAHDATTAELSGESPLEMFRRMYPKKDSSDDDGVESY